MRALLSLLGTCERKLLHSLQKAQRCYAITVTQLTSEPGRPTAAAAAAAAAATAPNVPPPVAVGALAPPVGKVGDRPWRLFRSR